MEWIPYFILIMIGYDLSIHLVYLFGFDKMILKNRLNWWPQIYGFKYQVFWSIFWGLAFLLLLIFILTS